MKNLQRFGGFAAFYLALAYLTGIVLFMFVLNSLSVTEPADRLTLLINNQTIIYLTNVQMYVLFGVFLTVLTLALDERLAAASPAIIRTATVIGMIWAGVLIASGMIANAGIGPTVALYGKDPQQAAFTWLAIESVSNGLSSANGELLGGLWTLLVSWAALQVNRLPRWLNYLGLMVGAIGIISAVPGLVSLVGLFAISQVLWFVSLGIVLLRDSNTADQRVAADVAPLRPQRG